MTTIQKVEAMSDLKLGAWITAVTLVILTGLILLACGVDQLLARDTPVVVASIADDQGLAVTLRRDGQFRLVRMADPEASVGRAQVNRFSFRHAGDVRFPDSCFGPYGWARVGQDGTLNCGR